MLRKKFQKTFFHFYSRKKLNKLITINKLMVLSNIIKRNRQILSPKIKCTRDSNVNNALYKLDKSSILQIEEIENSKIPVKIFEVNSHRNYDDFLGINTNLYLARKIKKHFDQKNVESQLFTNHYGNPIIVFGKKNRVIEPLQEEPLEKSDFTDSIIVFFTSLGFLIGVLMSKNKF